jgi:hypothetical protein
MCVGYRKLKAITHPFEYHIARCDDSLDNFGDSHGQLWITSLDGRTGFHQIAVHPADCENLAFFHPTCSSTASTSCLSDPAMHPDLIQSYLDKCLELFAVVGLQVNAIKTVSMTSSPSFQWPAHTIGAYSRRLSGEPVMYEAREMVLEECEVCGKSMQHRSLKRHVSDQHAEVLNFAPPSLYSPSPARRGPRHFDVTWNYGDEMVDCPVPLCKKSCLHRTDMTPILASDITTKDSLSMRTLHRTSSANCA